MTEHSEGETRKAVVRGPGLIEIEKLSMPKCPNGGVIVKVVACAICGTDVESLFHSQRMAQLPPELGHELSGIVSDVGAGVEEFHVGDRVLLNQSVPCGECPDCERGYENLCDRTLRIGGGFAEYISIPPIAIQKGNLLKIPGSLSFQAATLTEALAAVINGQELMDIRLGDTVLVIGAGAVGSMHCQLAKARGVFRVIQTDINAERLKAAGEVSGADLLTNSSGKDLIAWVKKETHGIGVEKVIVACSSGTAQEEALQLVAKRGVVNYFGFTFKDWPWIKFDSNACHYREFSVTGAFAYSRRQFKLALDLLAKGVVNAEQLITHVFPLERLMEAMEIMKQGAGLKVLVEP
jgi:L-iditol 2-dehydrogenase